MKSIIKLLFCLLLINNYCLAKDQNMGPANITYNIALKSQYISRGSQLSNGTAISFGSDIYLPHNIYFGFWTSSIDDSYHLGSSQEIDYYFGITPKFGNWGTRIAYQSYLYPGNSSGDNNPFSSEFVGEINYTTDRSFISYRHYWQDQASQREFFKTTFRYNFENFITSFEYGDKVNIKQSYYSATISKNVYNINWSLEYVSNHNPGATGNAQSRDYLTLAMRKSF